MLRHLAALVPLTIFASCASPADQWTKIDRAARHDLDRRYPSGASRDDVRRATGAPAFSGTLDDAARYPFGAWCVERVRDRAGDRAQQCDLFMVSGGSSGFFEDWVFYDAAGGVVSSYRRFAD